MPKKKCCRCQKKKELELFPKCSSKPDGRSSCCSDCNKKYQKKHYAANRQYYIDKSAKYVRGVRVEVRAYLDEQKKVPCRDCGKSFPPCAMDFDHVRGKKLFNVGSSMRMLLWAKGFEKVMEEVAKCEVVCAVCHRIRTHERRMTKLSSNLS